MTRDNIRRMAREAGLYATRQTSDPYDWQAIRDERFAALVAAAESKPLLQALADADRIMGHDDEATEWRERWKHLFGVAGSARSPWRESAAQGCSPGGTGMPAAPPQRKPLPASDIVTMYDERPMGDSDMIEFARAIERAHGIGGQP